MKSFFTIIILFWSLIAFSMSFKQSSSNPGHKQSFQAVFEGLQGGEMDNVYKIASNIPDGYSERFYGKDGLTNHRYVGHWGWSADIPKETFEKLEKKGFSKKQVVENWAKIKNKAVDSIAQKTGLPNKTAGAFTGVLYDVHLLHDFTGQYDDALLKPAKICDDIVKNLHTLFGNNSDFVKELEKQLRQITANPNLNNIQKAREMLNVLENVKLGEKMYATYGRFLSKKGIKLVYSKTGQKMLETVGEGIIDQFSQKLIQDYLKTLNIPKEEAKKATEKIIKQRKVILTEFEKKGKKAYRFQLVFQRNPAERAASKYAKEIIKQSGGKINEAEFIKLLEDSLRESHQKGLIAKNITEDQIKEAARKAGSWAKLNPKTLGLQTGIVTLIFSEGMTIFQFSETDMSEEEFIKETLKNTGEASLSAMIMTCSIYLGANPFTWPHGLIIAGIEFGTIAIYNFAFTNIQQYLDSQIFTLDDFLGDLPPEIRDRTTSLSNAAYKEMKRENTKRLNAIEYENRQNALISNSLNIYETHKKENVFTEGKDSNDLIKVPKRKNVFTIQKGK